MRDDTSKPATGVRYYVYDPDAEFQRQHIQFYVPGIRPPGMATKPIYYQPTAMLAYYCYLIIGHDFDSYQRLGGTPYFSICEDIVNACQSASMDNIEQKGWLAFDSNRNRYALINNLLDEAFKKYRNYYYEYHRLGLDEMINNVTNGRARIAEGLPTLRDAYRARPATYVVNTFLDAKAEELVDIFSKGSDKEKKAVYDILMDIDPTRQNTYDKILNN